MFRLAKYTSAVLNKSTIVKAAAPQPASRANNSPLHYDNTPEIAIIEGDIYKEDFQKVTSYK